MEFKDLIAELRTILAPHLGVFKPSNLPAIAVEPGPPTDPQIEGLLCVVQRVPVNDSEPTTGGFYHPDELVIKLITYPPAVSLDKALRLIQSNFVTRKCIYLPPTSQSREQARIHIFNPIFTSKE
ncbi:MAG TPA: hypothetical protein V6D10_17700 [Trichocoleus sp.]|jgi:hypothetical protein